MNTYPLRPIYYGLLSFAISAIIVTFSSQLFGTSPLLFVVIAPVGEEVVKAWVSKRFAVNDSIIAGARSGYFFGLIEAAASFSVTGFLLRSFTTIPMHMATFALDAHGVSQHRYRFILLAILVHALFNALALVL